MRVAANLSMLFTNVDLLQRYELAARAGFRLVEVSLPYSQTAETLKEEADRHGLQHVLINAPPGDWAAGMRGLAALPYRVDEFKKSIETAIHYARVLDCRRSSAESGIVFKENIAFAASRLAQEGMICLIEPINAHSMPGYYLNSFSKARDVLAAVNAPNLKIQFDVFHAQLIQGQLAHTIRALRQQIGHVQVAQAPDRHEPDSPGEINYNFVFDELQKNVSDCVVGLEYVPATGDFSFISRYGLSF